MKLYSNRLVDLSRRSILSRTPAWVGGLFLASGCAGTSLGAALPVTAETRLQAQASSGPEQDTMADFRISKYETYLSAWSPVPDADRLRLLRESLATDITFENANQNREGIADMMEHIAGFQRAMPGGSFRLLAMLGFDNYAMATWQSMDASGRDGFMGYDTLTFDRSNRIASIVMFTRIDKQMVK